MGCIRCILSTCILQNVLPKCDVVADSGCCLSFQKVSSPSGSKNDLPVNPDVSESSDKSTIPHHSSGSLMNPFNFGDGKDILQRSVVISLHSGLDVQNSDLKMVTTGAVRVSFKGRVTRTSVMRLHGIGSKFDVPWDPSLLIFFNQCGI